MTQSIAYASARIDGVLDCKTMKIGILKTLPQATPVVAFHVLAGLQRHPVWALDRLAAVVYCYCLAVRKHAESSGGGQLIELNLCANLVSGSEAVCIIASSINWHTSKEIRDQAEGMIARMTGTGVRWAKQWPFRDTLQMPVIKPKNELR
jgi:hypothetical protein